jgi:hypothetical protein
MLALDVASQAAAGAAAAAVMDAVAEEEGGHHQQQHHCDGDGAAGHGQSGQQLARLSARLRAAATRRLLVRPSEQSSSGGAFCVCVLVCPFFCSLCCVLLKACQQVGSFCSHN